MNKCEELHSGISECQQITKNRVVQLDRNALNTSQYIRKEIIVIYPAPTSIPDNVLEK